MIAGIGDGTFAVLVAFLVAMLAAVVGGYLIPDAVLPITVGCIALPLVVYGCILSAPHKVTPVPFTDSPYRERPPPTSDLIDTYLPVRITVSLLLILSSIAGVGYQFLTILKGPAYQVPRMRCLRERLEQAHPTWYR